MSGLTPEEKRELAELEARFAAEQGAHQGSGTYRKPLPGPAVMADSLLNGITMGYGSETAAATSAAIDGLKGENVVDSYRRNHAANEARLQQGREDYPPLAALSEGTAMALPGLAIAKGIDRGMDALGVGRGLFGNMGRGGVTGGSEASVYGTGEGAPGERLQTGMDYAPYGAAAGVVAAPVVGAGAKALGILSAPLAAAVGLRNGPRANRVLQTYIDRSGKAPGQITAELAAANRRGSPMVMADVLGHPGQRGLVAQAKRPGGAQREIIDFLNDRQAGQPERIGAAIDEEFATGGQTAQARTDALKAERKVQSGQNYDAARGNAAPVDISEVVAEIDRQLAGPLQAGVALNPAQKQLQKLRKQLVNAEGKPVDTFELALDAKIAANDVLTKARQRGQGNTSRLVGGANAKLDAALEDASDMYRTANDEHKRMSRNIDAVDEGAQLARPNQRPEDVATRFRAMTPEQRESARVGYADRLLEANARGAFGVNRARPLTSPKSVSDIELMGTSQPPLGTTAGPRLLNQRVADEDLMFQTRAKATGGSATAENLEDAADAEMLESALTGNWRQQLMRGIASAAKGETEAMRQQIARALLARNPSTALAEVAKQSKSDRTKRLIVEALARQGMQRGLPEWSPEALLGNLGIR